MTNNVATRLDIAKMVVGDDWKRTIEVVDINDEPFDWTLWTDPYIQVRDHARNIIVDFQSDEIILTTGYFTLTKERQYTADLYASAYKYDFQINDADSDRTTIFSGNFTIENEVTI